MFWPMPPCLLRASKQSSIPLSEFKSYPQGHTLGVGLTIGMPTGQYDSSKVINFGANRWAFKPEVGYSAIHGP